MTILACTTAGALVETICSVRFVPGDLLSVGGTIYAYVDETTAYRDGQPLRVVNMKRTGRHRSAGKPKFVA